MTVKQAFENFIFAKQIQGCSAKTIKCYRDFCSSFIKFIGLDTDISTLNNDLYNKYIKSLYERTLSQSTRATYITHFKSFVHWVSNEYGLDLQYEKIKVPKTAKKIVRIYNSNEIKQIFASVTTDEEWITVRNKCIIALMLDCGLRQNEVCTISRENINSLDATIKVTGKGNKERIVPLGIVTQQLMAAYDKLCPYKEDFFFATHNGDRLTTNAVKQFMRKIARKLSFPFSSHKLRHNFATNYCLNHYEQFGKVDIYSLMLLMGHEKVETTRGYLHFAQQIIATKTSISHLDKVLIS